MEENKDLDKIKKSLKTALIFAQIALVAIILKFVMNLTITMLDYILLAISAVLAVMSYIGTRAINNRDK